MNKKITKANNVRNMHPMYVAISEALSTIEIINHVKIYNGRIKASNEISKNGKKEPITNEREENITGVELLVDISRKVIQFYSITSSVKGNGEKIVSSVMNSTPSEWKVVVLMDWSGGFWQVSKTMAPLRGAIAEDKELCRLKSDKLKLNVTPSNGSSQTLNALLILSVMFKKDNLSSSC